MRNEKQSSVAKSTHPSSSFSWSFFQKYTLFLLTPCVLAIWKLSSIDFDVFIKHATIDEDQFFLPPNVTSTSSKTTQHATKEAPNVTSSSSSKNRHGTTKEVQYTEKTTPISVSTGHVAWDISYYHRWKTAQQSVDDDNNIINDDDDWYFKRIANATAVIAYATTITSCQANRNGHTFLDMAAVLAHSIHLSSIRNPNSTSTYDYQLYAFIHPDAIADSTWCADQMNALGYIVQIRETPINVSMIQRQAYVDRLLNPNSGCCGAKEFLKFYSYTLMEHPIVVHVDLDVLILKPLDEFFHAMLLPDSVDRYIEHAMWPEDRHLMAARTRRVISAMFTRDYPMLAIKDGNTRKHVKIGVQGGFLMIRPNITIFNELCQLVLQGDFDAGWYEVDPARPDKKKVHYPGFYGAAQVQGLLAFYYGHVNRNQTVELNRCVVNNMVDDPWAYEGGKPVCITGQTVEECQDCRLFNISDIYTAHFTFCFKPSHCSMAHPQPLCYALHSEWHRIRYDLETVLLANDRDDGEAIRTSMIQELEPPKLRDFYGHCTKGGSYATMDWQNLTSILKKLTMGENGG